MPPTPPAAPGVALPKGGGAVRGIGEKFAANTVTGTGSMSVPIWTSPGRDGFGPSLSLSYDSGSGNGPFGLGWTMPVATITRRTDTGLPRYDDTAESDVFVLAGAEDLAPVLDPAGARVGDVTTAPGYTIDRFGPRVEGLFSRIERWTRDDGAVHWRTISQTHVLSLFGADGWSRIADPADSRGCSRGCLRGGAGVRRARRAHRAFGRHGHRRLDQGHVRTAEVPAVSPLRRSRAASSKTGEHDA